MTSSLPPMIQSSSNTPKKIFNHIASFALNSSASVKIFCLCVFLGYLISFRTGTIPYLSVVPGKLLPPNFFIWTLATHSFIEIRLIELIADWFIILLYSKMIEPLWGVLECVQFYFLITALVAISSSIFYFVAFALTFDEYFLFNIRINGLGGLLGGFGVAIKQIMPDTVILNANFIRLKQDHLPLLLILFSFFLYLIGLTDLTYLVMLTNGTFIGWVYLRFFQKHKNGTRGDASSTFVFASFFPAQIQPFVAILSNTIFNILVKIKVCKKPPIRYNASASGTQSQITINLPLVNAGIENSDAERRRQKALKALKERLKKPDDEDVTNQWADRNSNESTSLIQESVEIRNENMPGQLLSDKNTEGAA